MSGLTDSESSMVSALLENATQNPLRCLSEDLSYVFESGEFDAAVDAFNAEVNPDPKPKTMKRHYGQRSRVRKLQYIAELERTVNVLQTLGSELAARVASLMQERVILSIENSNLKQQLSSLQTEKMIKEGQHLFLKNEKERLKKLNMNHLGNKRRPYYQMGPTEAELSVNSWQALDMNKLSLGGRSVPLKHGFGSS
ncbi:Uncharacterized protein QJS10_CPB19g00478 [Acorus calamus]|uniref:BZIP domain-containing protein n=1 Tax=Acorus calamus TaxID=4465 RepID=A0AAV9CKJ2_ACOCL|nr:Uncharacterized protein QJS10_CPB19g00478 [Acorus calamus]